MNRQSVLPGAADAAIRNDTRSRGQRPSSTSAGRVRALREAIDDAQSVLIFARAGLASGAIDPERALWVIDLAPADGERAWRVLGEIASRGPRAPMIRYLACCRDEARRRALRAHPLLHPLLVDGRLAIDDEQRWLRVAAPRNPLVVLAHEGLSSRGQRLYRRWRGALQEADADGECAWRTPERRDGPVRLLANAWPDSSLLTLPLEAMSVLAALLDLSDGRLLLRASDFGCGDAEAIRAGALGRADDELRLRARLPVNFDALARWHRAAGGSVLQSQRSARGRMLHLALHDRGAERLRECLPELLDLPHPDDHAHLLRALRALRNTPPSQCLSLLHTAQADPRALAALSRHLLPALADLDAPAGERWRTLLARCRKQHYPPPLASGDRLRRVLDDFEQGLPDHPATRATP
jgi:hypothetical protein